MVLVTMGLASPSTKDASDARASGCYALFDRAFDRGLITFDTDLRVVVSKRLKDASQSAELGCSLREAEGRRLLVPSRFPPAPESLEHHRQ